jgi:putative PIN family toxin of toxin-antitoxin system
MPRRVVLDTNVVVSALRSRQSAAWRLFQRVGTAAFDHVLSVALILEYEAVCTRPGAGLHLSATEIEDVLEYLALTGLRQPIHFLWRPMLPDPADDHVLDLAVAARASIVTYNQRDFGPAAQFGIAVLTPHQFLTQLGENR